MQELVQQYTEAELPCARLTFVNVKISAVLAVPLISSYIIVVYVYSTLTTAIESRLRAWDF